MRTLTLPLLLSVGLLVAACGDSDEPTIPLPEPAPAPAQEVGPTIEEDLGTKLEKNCALCHQLPPPDALPSDAWRYTVDKMFELANLRLTGVYEHRILGYTPQEAAEWYAERAPESFGEVRAELDPAAVPPAFDILALRPATSSGKAPGVCNVKLLPLDGPGAPWTLVASDMVHGRVMVGDPRHPEQPLRTIARLPAPSRTAVADLDGDGRNELLVADLGQFLPTDDRLGAIFALSRGDDGTYSKTVLARRLGRVADVQPADLDGDGDIDIVAAVFGWYSSGEVIVLWNQTPDGAAELVFERESLDQRSGAMNVPLMDIDGDGDLDIVTVYSQEHERVVVYRQVMPGKFAARDLWIGPHPHWGSTNIEPTDLDGDGDVDFVLTNGDAFDDDVVIKPYHGVAWLENRGNLEFVHRRIMTYPGAHVARAADFDGDGDVDIVAGSFLPSRQPGDETPRPPGMVFLEQIAPGTFRAAALRETRCAVATLDVSDLNGDGLPDVIAGALYVVPPYPEDQERVGEILLSKRK